MARRSPAASCDRIAELAQTLAELAQTLAQALEDAADAGSRASRDGMQFVGRGNGFTDTAPTATGGRNEVTHGKFIDRLCEFH